MLESKVRYRPHRRWSSEIFPLAALALMVITLFFSFPLESVGFVAQEVPRQTSAFCQLVALTAEEEQAALAAARASWQHRDNGRRYENPDLLSADLIAAEIGQLPNGARRVRFERDNAAHYVFDSVPNEISVASPPPVRLPQEELQLVEKDRFSRAELLRIDP